MRWILILLFLLVGCCGCPVPDGDDFEVTLSPDRAQRGEEVTVTLSATGAENARVLVGGVEVNIEVTNSTTLIFEVPEEAESGSQEVLVLLEDQTSASRMLGVFGDDIVPDRVMAVLAPLPMQSEIDEGALVDFLRPLEFTLIDQDNEEDSALSPLEGDIGPCSGELALIDTNGAPLGQALEALEALEAAGIAIPLGTDGVSVHAGGQIELPDYLEAVRADAAFERGLGGDGVTIAVLDSGVTDNREELVGRLLDGYNAIADDTDTQDNDVHGTPIAFLAAGSTFGVAQEALVLPVKVCEGGDCLSSDVVKGMCWALSNAPDGPEQLVMNLSLGGDTPSEIIASLLSAAIERGVAVAASGGNAGNGGPARYPAAQDLDGLMAVASVEQDFSLEDQEAFFEWVPSDFSTWGEYIDIAAPRIDIFDGIPFLGDERIDGDNVVVGRNTGTSFSTPLVAGTMAVLKGADSSLTPAEIQTCIEQGAQKLPDPPNPPEAVGAGLLDVAGALEACGL